jgi:hypothetical protein
MQNHFRVRNRAQWVMFDEKTPRKKSLPAVPLRWMLHSNSLVGDILLQS